MEKKLIASMCLRKFAPGEVWWANLQQICVKVVDLP